MQAWLKHPIGRPSVDEIEVTMISRKPGRRVLVQFNRGQHMQVDRYRLRNPVDRRTQLTDAELARLPWGGTGIDPETQAAGDIFAGLDAPPGASSAGGRQRVQTRESPHNAEKTSDEPT